MKVYEKDWFDSNGVMNADGVKIWQKEVFSRAYCQQNGPFTRVCNRLRSDFSVLVYLPGNCMSAAADYVKGAVSSGNWKDYGEHPGRGSLADVWRDAGGIVENIRAWLTGKGTERQNVIFHNLDLLGDGHGGVFGALEAQTALFSIIEGTRKGVVLGLADREADRLPQRIESTFGETMWLYEIPTESFGYLIPTELGRQIAEKDSTGLYIPDGRIWLLASRLRWTDPVRTVNIMADAALAGDWTAILSAIWKATRSIDFADPGPEFGEIAGVPRDILNRLQHQVVDPYRRWLDFAGSPEEGEGMLRRLVPGLVLHGPPGTGKTFLARWLADSLRLPVRVVSGTDIKTGPWGDAERKVRRVFDEARRVAPCVLVFDDADDLFSDRNRAQGSLAEAERGVVDTALQQLDGFAGRPSGVLVILTTNRLSAVDAAILRRLKLKELIPYPLTSDQAEEIVASVAQSYRYRLTEDIVVRLTERFMGAVAFGGKGGVPTTPEERRNAKGNLFSPSEIQLAMQLLENPQKIANYGSDGRYKPDKEDVKRMEDYYEQLPPTQDQ
jgi:hypothetical protein